MIKLHNESKQLSVTLDKSFPRVEYYEWFDERIEGQNDKINQVKINNQEYVPEVEVNESDTGDQIDYLLEISDVAKIKINIKVTENGLDFNVTELIALDDSNPIRSFEIPEHNLVTINSKSYKAKQVGTWATGEFKEVFDEFIDLAAVDLTDEIKGRTYGILNTDIFAVTILNNVITGNDKVRVDIRTSESGTKKASIYNGAWIYQENDVFSPEELPWSKVVFAKDENNDGQIDWQDAAIMYRKIADSIEDGYLLTPYGSDMIGNHIPYVSVNIGSTNTNPFLRTFDNAKKIANLTDEFGQLILYKGYQAEGHDDSHPDYGGHVGVRQGGLKDFNYVLEESKKINVVSGVHVNATEFMLDAYDATLENIEPLEGGWRWLDQAYLVDRYNDLLSGDLEERFDKLKDDTGNLLDFIYVDVYSGVDYKAKKLAQIINDRGWMLGTEYAGPIYEQVAFNHWGTDPGLNVGNESIVSRFIRNHVMDGFALSPLLKGVQQAGVGYWQNTLANKSYKYTQEMFFNHNLPTKYMQHFPITKITDARVDFEDNVYVERQNDGKIHLLKDGHLIAMMTDEKKMSDSTVFIPWDPIKEDKIYHWNKSGGKTTWTIPNSWSNVNTAVLYKLTDIGREFVQDVSINSNEVQINAQAEIGYVLYAEEPNSQEDRNFGAGGYVKDPGFDRRNFEDWTISSSTEETGHIQMIKDENWDGQLEVSGQDAARIEQEITNLVTGKAYTASVWVNISGNRKVSLGVKQEDEIVSNWMDNTDHPYYAAQHKYQNTHFQQVKVRFEAKSSEALLYLEVDHGEGTVYFDDVRIWENITALNPEHSNYVLYEDFENVDEGWGPFVYGQKGLVQTHLAECQENKDQVKSFVIDGNFSLKTNENGKGEWLRTLPQTLRLEPNETYKVKCDINATTDDMYEVAVRIKENEEVRTLASKFLPKGEHMVELDVKIDNEKDAYLAIIKHFDDESECGGMLVIDNIVVIQN